MLSGRGKAIVAVHAALWGLAFIAVASRCYVRIRMKRAFGWDDGLMVLAMVCTAFSWEENKTTSTDFPGKLFNTFFLITSIYGPKYGVGKHLTDVIVHPENIAISLKV